MDREGWQVDHEARSSAAMARPLPLWKSAPGADERTRWSRSPITARHRWGLGRWKVVMLSRAMEAGRGRGRLSGEPLDFVQRARVAIVRRQYAEAVKISASSALLDQPGSRALVLGMAFAALQLDEGLRGSRRARGQSNGALAWLMKGEALIGKRDLGKKPKACAKRVRSRPISRSRCGCCAAIARARARGFVGSIIEPKQARREYPAPRAAR